MALAALLLTIANSVVLVGLAWAHDARIRRVEVSVHDHDSALDDLYENYPVDDLTGRHAATEDGGEK